MIAVLMAVSMGLTACKNGAAASGSGSDNTTAAGSGAAAQNVVIGEVSDVTGNDITIKMFTMPANYPQMLENMFDPNATQDPNATRGGGNRLMQTDANGKVIVPTNADGSPAFQGRGNGGNGGSFQMPTNADGSPAFQGGGNGGGGGYFRNGGNATDANGQTETTQGRDYTGEEKEIIIPVGMDINTLSGGSGSSSGGGGRQLTTITQDKIKTGSLLIVTYASDGTTITKVDVLDASMSGMLNFGGFGQRGTGTGAADANAADAGQQQNGQAAQEYVQPAGG